MAPQISAPALRLVRLPGEFGPIVRCYGELSVATAEALRRELALLLPMGHSVLTLNLAGCTFVDVDGILTVLHTYRELRRKGSRLMVVTGTDRVARMLHFMTIDRIIPMFPIEETALRALRGMQLPEPGPSSWEAARDQTLARWRAIREMIDEESPEEVERQITSMTGLCERSEELFQELPAPATARCQFCPLFYELGGQAEDVGCQSVIDPILQLVQSGDKETARGQMTALIRTIEEMPVPEEVTPPVPWQSSGLRLAAADSGP